MEKYQKTVVTGCLIRDGKVLLVKRAETEKFLPGYYEMPGGKCNFGEAPEKALEREFQEEVGLKVKVLRPYHTFSYLMEEGNRHTVEIVFLVEVGEGVDLNIQLSQEHTDYAWLNPDELQGYLISDEVKEAIRAGAREINLLD